MPDHVLLGFIKLMKRKALRKHSLHEKTAASVLLKPFISSYESNLSVLLTKKQIKSFPCKKAIYYFHFTFLV